METIVTILSSLGVGGLLTAIITHWLNKRKFNSEVKTTDISNLEKSLEFYKKVFDDQSKKLSTYMRQTEHLMVEVAVVNESVSELYKLSCINVECPERQMLKSQDYHMLLNKLKVTENLNSDGDRS